MADSSLPPIDPRATEDILSNPDVCPVLARFVRHWHYAVRVDPYNRCDALGRFYPLLRGTAGGRELAQRRAWLAVDWLLRVNLPTWLELCQATQEHAADLRALPEIVTAQAAQAALSLAESVWRLDTWLAAESAAWTDASGYEWARKSGSDLDPDRDAVGDALDASAWTAAEEAHEDFWQVIWSRPVRHYFNEHPGVLDGVRGLAKDVAWVALGSIARDAAAAAGHEADASHAGPVNLAAYRATRTFLAPATSALQAAAAGLLERMIDEKPSST